MRKTGVTGVTEVKSDGATRRSVIAVTTTGLVVGMAFLAELLWLWGMAHPAPEDDSPALALFVLPLFVPCAFLLALALTVALVLPSLWCARRVGARMGREDAWWWPPLLGAPVSAGPVALTGLAALPAGAVAAPEVYLVWWGLIAALVVPGTLLARLARRRAVEGRPLRAVRTVLGRGIGAVVVSFVAVLGGAAALAALLN